MIQTVISFHFYYCSQVPPLSYIVTQVWSNKKHFYCYFYCVNKTIPKAFDFKLNNLLVKLIVKVWKVVILLTEIAIILKRR